VKSGLLAGGRLWDDVRAWPAGGGTPEARLDLVRRCAALKARVVAQDPTEQGVRAVLNLGHTIGHAVESAAGHGRLAHGAAVAIGLLPALWLSSRLAGLDASVAGEVRELLVRQGLPVSAPGLNADDVLAALRRDKKRRDGQVRFVLLEAVGKPVHGVAVEDALVREAVGRALAPPG
jgi:3-dehydroquinate synthetase